MIMTPLWENVNLLNDIAIKVFKPDIDARVYLAHDEMGETSTVFPPEVVRQTSIPGLPNYSLSLKEGAPLLLMINYSPKDGLCNGTRLKVLKMMNKCLHVEITSGAPHHIGNQHFLPRIPRKCTDKLPFNLTRTQFPVCLAFAITINKAQGQTIRKPGIFLPDYVFSHGQLYVALGRVPNSSNIKILTFVGKFKGLKGVYTRNVVYKEVLEKVHGPRKRYHIDVVDDVKRPRTK